MRILKYESLQVFIPLSRVLWPEPNNYSLLVANITINKVNDRIITINSALGSKNDETLEFEVCKENQGDNRVRSTSNINLFNEAVRPFINVKSNTFDKMVSDIQKDNTLIWMDVQGYEGFVVSGASKALNQAIPICMEFWPYSLERSGCYELLKSAFAKTDYKTRG